MSGGPQKVVFLDRDGTINVDHGQRYVSSVQDWQLAPRVITGLKLLQEQGFVLAVVTNQSGIAYGLYTAADMRAVHEHMVDELAKEGVTIAAIAFCPHDRESTCDCRKPQPGMSKHIEEQIGAIDYGSSWTIGDRLVDLHFGHNIGTQTALLNSKYWTADELSAEPTIIADSLYEAAQNIASMEK